jgi:isoquinoline 1-oxidoreductase beta subunit
VHSPQVAVPVLWMRSVGSSHNAFSRRDASSTSWRRCAGKDPVEYGARCSTQHPRHRAVLDLAGEKAGWGKPLAAEARSKARAGSPCTGAAARSSRRSRR